MKLPYITKLEGIGGKIKSGEEDFKVEEIPLYEFSGSGEHLLVRIEKTDLNTKEVANKISEVLNVRKEKVSFSGIKDKISVSKQWFSVHLPGKEIDLEKLKEDLENKSIKVLKTDRHGNKLKPGHLKGNRFDIKIRDLAVDVDEAIRRVEEITKIINEGGFPNYYGEQRFGFQGSNIPKGRDLILGKLRIRDGFLKKLMISAYQSYLCNLYLAERVKLGFGKLMEGDIMKKADTGGIFTVENLSGEQERSDNKEVSFTAPIFGFKLMSAKGESGKLEESILSGEDMKIEDFKKVKVQGARRLGRVFPEDLKIFREGNCLVISFFLPKGSFATILLREIMKNE